MTVGNGKTRTQAVLPIVRQNLGKLLNTVRMFRSRSPVAAFWGVVCLLLVLMALAAPIVAPDDPIIPDFTKMHAEPDSGSWFGTDDIHLFYHGCMTLPDQRIIEGVDIGGALLCRQFKRMLVGISPGNAMLNDRSFLPAQQTTHPFGGGRRNDDRDGDAQFAP